MSIYVFLGPTLGWDDARRELDVHACAPAAVGDVYRIACRRPTAIGIVDGFFDRIPSVWHKEILWALSEGIHVFGAASMGALRAAELADYGMHGVGEVFAAFRSGELEDDDEVAVAHADAEHGYRPLSEAMVNIRATLAAAEASGVVARETTATLRTIAKGLFYADRSYDRVLRAAPAAGVSPTDIEDLRRWLPEGRVDVKRRDAQAMLRELAAFARTEQRPKTVAFRFEHTHTWQALQRQCGLSEARHYTADDEAILDELRLHGRFRAARRAALARVLALAHARESGKGFPNDVRATADALLRERGLSDPVEFQQWVRENELDPIKLDLLLRDEARVSWVDESLAHASTGYIVDHLRITGEYASLRRTAEEKAQCLTSRAVGERDMGRADGIDEVALWRWFFVDRLHEAAVPGDIGRYAEEVCCCDKASLRRAVVREYLAAKTT